MSLSIVNIRQAAESLVATTLGSPYRKIPYDFDPEMNDSRSLENGYSVLWGRAAQVYEIDQKVNLEQDLFVLITKRVYVRNDDSKTITEMDTVYSAIGTILDKFIMTKIGLPGIIQRVELTEMGEPLKIGQGRDLYQIKLQFKVRYLV